MRDTLILLLLAAGLHAEPSFTPLYKPTCFASACHVYTPGGVGAGFWIEHINGASIAATFTAYSVTVVPGQPFTVDFRARGLVDPVTLKDPDVSGLITVEAHQFWTVSAGPTWNDNGYSGSTPWKLTSTANQTYISNFTAAESANNKLCATSDRGVLTAPADKNALVSDEVMSATILPSVYLGAGPHRLTITALGYHHDYGAVWVEAPIIVNVLPPVTPVNSPTYSLTPTRTPSFSPSPTFTITPTALPVSACASTAIFGNDLIGPQSGLRNGMATCVKVTNTASGVLRSIRINYTTFVAPSLRVACYADAAGKPGALLAESAAQAGVAGWNELALPPVAVTPGTYWLAWQQTSGIVPYNWANFGDSYSYLQAFGAFAATAPAGGSYYQQSFPIVAALCVAAAGSPTASPTRSASPSPTRSATPSSTISPSPTVSASPSPSSTHSPSPTFTASPSPSSTISPSPTFTASPSATPTFSPTRTGSPTISPSPSATPSASPSVTPTWTPPPAGSSPTATPSATASFSASPSGTPSFSATPSSSPTATMTGTATATPSASTTATVTESSSATITPSITATATGSATDSATPSSTATATDSPSATATASSTTSPTVTETGTATISPSATPTSTQSETFSPSPSISMTPSISPTASHSPTITETATPSNATATAVPANSFTGILAPVLAPNPAFGSSCTLAYRLVAPADRVQLRFYTAAMTLAAELDLGPRPAGLNVGPLALPPELSNQVYFAQLTAGRGRQDARSAVFTLYVLR
jgi:hypothetical protein